MFKSTRRDSNAKALGDRRYRQRVKESGKEYKRSNDDDGALSSVVDAISDAFDSSSPSCDTPSSDGGSCGGDS